MQDDIKNKNRLYVFVYLATPRFRQPIVLFKGGSQKTYRLQKVESWEPHGLAKWLNPILNY